jgi:hypothetical protein
MKNDCILSPCAITMIVDEGGEYRDDLLRIGAGWEILAYPEE